MMSRTARVALVLVLAITACHDKQQVQNQPPLAPPIEDTPPPPPSKAPANLPPPVISEPQPQQPAVQAQETPPPTPPKPKHHKRTPAELEATELAQNNAPPQVSAEGNFTPTEPANLRNETSGSITQIEKDLNAITRKLSEPEQKTRDQIREFLKQAKTALASGDVAGAHTLALKANVLLGELNQ